MVDLRKRRLFTRSEAADIINLFEDVLIENNICVPSPEDEERGPDDYKARLFVNKLKRSKTCVLISYPLFN